MIRKFIEFEGKSFAPKIQSRRMGISAVDSFKNACYREDGEGDGDNPAAMVIKSVKAVKTALAETTTTANEALAIAKEAKVLADEADKRAKALDAAAGGTLGGGGATTKKTFGAAFTEALTEQKGEMEKALAARGGSFRIELKDVGVMTTATHLSGTPMMTYRDETILKPTQKVKFRDLINTTQSQTAVLSQYRETGGEGNVDWQSTQGLTKAKLDIIFTEERKVSQYLAATTDFAKQLAKNLPFLTNTLSRILLRKFFKKESASFYETLHGAATGGGSTSETNDIKQIIDYISYQRDMDYEASYAVMSNTTLGNLNKALIDAGTNFQGQSGIVTNGDGSLRVNNTSIIPASFVPAGRIMILDTDYIERVEAESVVIEFSQENATNFEKNLITARIECMEVLNILDPAAHVSRIL